MALQINLKIRQVATVVFESSAIRVNANSVSSWISLSGSGWQITFPK
jgi:hypothetical protein